MLTNPRDAFRGQSRSPNTVQFDMLDMVSYCSIVSWSLTRTVFEIFDFNYTVTLKLWLRVTQGHQNRHYRSAIYDFLLTFHGPIS